MLWEEIDLDKQPVPDDLARGVAAAFGLKARDVLVSGDLMKVERTIPVIIEAKRTGGEFPLRIALYLREDFAKPAKAEFMKKLATALGARILVSDQDPNPYSRTLYDPSGGVQAVFVDVKALDDRGELEIAKTTKPEAAPARSLARSQVSHLIEAYRDMPLQVWAETRAQSDAFGELYEALAALPESGPIPKDGAARVRHAAAEVRSAFTTALLKKSSSVSLLLQAADIVSAQEI